MKRKGYIYDQIISEENLLLAAKKASIGKQNSYGVKLFFSKNTDEKIKALHNSLKNGSFKTSNYHIFSIKTTEGKTRIIYRLPFYPDRIVHHAIMNQLEKIWVKSFISQTYSCIKNKGIHGAFYKIKSDLTKYEKETVYCLKFDIKKYYPNINHDILKKIIERKIKDTKVLNLLFEIIDSAPGVPIGNYLSQYFANLYLSGFDHFMKEKLKCRFYYRYADDIVVLSEDTNKLHEIFSICVNEISKLKLEIKSNYQIFPVKSRGIDFVGYKFFHRHVLLRKSIKKRFARKVKKSNGFNLKLFSAYYGWAKHCNSVNLLKKLAS